MLSEEERGTSQRADQKRLKRPHPYFAGGNTIIWEKAQYCSVFRFHGQSWSREKGVPQKPTQKLGERLRKKAVGAGRTKTWEECGVLAAGPAAAPGTQRGKSEGSFNGHRCWSRKFSMQSGCSR